MKALGKPEDGRRGVRQLGQRSSRRALARCDDDELLPVVLLQLVPGLPDRTAVIELVVSEHVDLMGTADRGQRLEGRKPGRILATRHDGEVVVAHANEVC